MMKAVKAGRLSWIFVDQIDRFGADVLVVDGDVLADIAVLEDRSRFVAVMQGGVVKAGQLLKPLAA
jgi:hypothetical protein